MTTHPSNFTGQSACPTIAAVPLQEWKPAPSVPPSYGCLTLYADGLVNLDGDATRTLAGAVGVTLYPPGRGRGRWLLLPFAEAEPEAVSLIGRDDRGHLRFRAAAMAAALFALVPPEQKALKLRLVDGPQNAFRLELA